MPPVSAAFFDIFRHGFALEPICTCTSASLDNFDAKVYEKPSDGRGTGVDMDLNFDKRIGQNVRRLRKQRGLTQDQLAARLQVQGCDVTRSALAKMEAGQRYFYSDELYCLRGILQCNFDELFREE